jgi:hypothetical protein
MSERKTEPEPDAKVLAELSAFADGTLDPSRADAVRELIAASPELHERYERELRAVEAMHELRADRAPAAVRIAIDARRRRIPRRRGRLLYAGALGAAAAVALALVLLLPGGSPGAPTVSQAAALATRGAVLPAPAEHGVKLNQDVQETYFPNWAHLRWWASGKRVDRLGNRTAVTVYYGNEHSQRVAYTIVTSPPLHRPTGRMNHVSGVAMQSFVQGGRTNVTWRRDGHTCVLSASGVSAAVLAKLAAWRVPGLDRDGR